MENFEYDLLYKYHLRSKLNEQNQYAGNGLENVSVSAPLSLFLEIEPTTNIPQNFVFATTIYLKDPVSGKVLFLKQNKKDRVVDEFVGLGGKARSIFNGTNLKGEKIPTSEALNRSMDFSLEPENLLAVACKEVMEETATYEKDEEGNYTSNITIKGLTPNPTRMQNIGLSKIRLILQNKAEAWMIYHYIYELSLEELEFLKNISYENREGILEWRDIDDTISMMSPADQIIIRNKNDNITVSEIRDKVNNFSAVRTKLSLPDKTIILLTEDSSVPENYQGIIMGDSKETFKYPEYKELSLVSAEQKNK